MKLRRRLLAGEAASWDFVWDASQGLPDASVIGPSKEGRTLLWDEGCVCLRGGGSPTFSRGLKLLPSSPLWGRVCRVRMVFRTSFAQQPGRDTGFGWDVHSTAADTQLTALLAKKDGTGELPALYFYQLDGGVSSPLAGGVWHTVEIRFDFRGFLSSLRADGGPWVWGAGQKTKWIYENTEFAISEAMLNADNRVWVRHLALSTRE